MRQPAKVIDIFTRKEITDPPCNVENAKDIMDYLMQYRNPRTGEAITPAEYEAINQLLYVLENNSGVMREEVFERGA